MPKRAAVYLGQVSPGNHPLPTPVAAQCLAGIGVELDQALVGEPRLFEA
jgi:hypothetical protein